MPRKVLSIPHSVAETKAVHDYTVTLLQRVLAVTEQQYGPVLLTTQEAATEQGRQILNLNNGISDIIWTVSSLQRDAKAKAVPIPIIGGLYGYRVLMVKKDDDRFLTTPGLSALKSMSLVQGANWPDRLILQSNNFKVDPATYRAGFRMVREGLADAYPRAVHEAYLEAQSEMSEGLKIESEILLVYPSPVFFYVAKTRHRLAARLTDGLQQLINSGELQQMLSRQTFYNNAQTMIRGRTVYELGNPHLSVTSRDAVNNYLKASPMLEYVRQYQNRQTDDDASYGENDV